VHTQLTASIIKQQPRFDIKRVPLIMPLVKVKVKLSHSRPDNTQHSKATNICVPGRIQTHMSVSKWLQTHALDHAATGISL